MVQLEPPPRRRAPRREPDPETAPEPRLTVAAAARRLGVAPATLRTWDRRYGIGPSGHEPGQHRRYSPDDLARLELMQHALLRGASSSDAARFALDARLPGGDGAPRNRPRPVPGGGSPVGPDEGRPVFADADGSGELGARVRVGGRVLRLPGAGRRARGLGRAALALDSAAARALLEDAVATLGPQAAWDEVARPVLVAVADRWAATGAGVEIEHLLSSCASAVFTASTARGGPVDARPVLLAGMPGEQHVLPLVVLAAALAERGVPSRPLGADLPADALVAALRRTAPAAVVLWSQLAGTADPAMVRGLPRTRPRARVFAAGPGWDGVELPPSAGRLESLAGAVGSLAALRA